MQALHQRPDAPRNDFWKRVRAYGRRRRDRSRAGRRAQRNDTAGDLSVNATVLGCIAFG